MESGGAGRTLGMYVWERLHGVFVGDWLFVFPLCGFSLSLFCNYVWESSDGYQVVWDSIGSYLGKLLLPRCGFTLSLFDHHVNVNVNVNILLAISMWSVCTIQVPLPRQRIAILSCNIQCALSWCVLRVFTRVT